MSEDTGSNAQVTSYEEIKRKLFAFGEEIGREGQKRHESGLLTESDAKEIQYGIFHLLSGIEHLFRDADVLMHRVPDLKVVILDLVEQSRALIGGALLVGRHMGATASVEALLADQRVAPMHRGKTDKKIKRAEAIQDLIKGAERHPADQRRLRHPGTVLEQARTRLRMPSLDRKTLMSYVSYIDQNGRIDIAPSSKREK